MDILSRNEVKKAIHYRQPLRPPIAEGLPFAKDYDADIKSLEDKHADDIESINITVSYWDAPSDDPDYRFAMRGMVCGSGISRDNYPIIKDWDQLDEFIDQFPGYFYKPAYDRIVKLREQYPNKYILVKFGHYLFWRLAEIRGLENFLMDIYSNPDKLNVVMDRLLKMYAMWAKKAKEAGADGIHGGEDIGTQRTLFCSPEKFREVFKDSYTKLGNILHDNGLDYWLHSCGNVTDIMDDLIDAGVDVIHPIQAGAMNDDEIIKKYQGKICFHVGMDVQHLIPFESEEVIYHEIKKRMHKYYLAQGGVIFGAGNILTKDISLQNIEVYRRAMFDFNKEILLLDKHK